MNLVAKLAIEHAMRITDSDTDVLQLMKVLTSEDINQKKLRTLIGKLVIKEKLPSTKTPLFALLNHTEISARWRYEVGVKSGSLFQELTYLENLLSLKLNPYECMYQRLEKARIEKDKLIKN